MSTEKLSELSKPASWSDERGNLCTNTIKERGMDSKYRQDYEKYSTPLYSQEYVSALLEDNERVARDLVARNGEIEGLRKRAAELESIRADASQVFKEIGNELGCNPDNESIMMAIDALKERLATPVRLPNKSDDEFWFDGVFQVAKFDRAVERAISAAGFKFVGDE
ncbi:TPA: hypothetical protein SMI09_000199 [Serratia marcescens]|nr:hypothetical protein [Serratia marcescens]HEJ7252847.1 hypothetical protein [Serratia marcescens]HEJ7909137.1 hypothetical protein [Serratia marcescens]HEJ7929261.1 hypothetical protein [Serratia marcescens]HEJ7956904.1 hypothetical protein [Serratia marcescens]